MTSVCVVTGAGSGIGLGAAIEMAKTDQKVIIVGRTVSKLEGALEEIRAEGLEAEIYGCDVSDRAAVDELVKFATGFGHVKTLIHAAGMSGAQTTDDVIFKINAVGTINVNEAFSEVMGEGDAILNVSSMSGYFVPDAITPFPLFKKAFTNIDEFLAEGLAILENPPEGLNGYMLSKKFVMWYTQRMAAKLGARGIRVNSIAPGVITTPMSIAEGELALSFALNGAMGRTGEKDEIGRMMAFMVSDECSYLDGVDILYDGGALAALNAAMDNQ